MSNAAAVAAAMQANLAQGLTAQQAARRLAVSGPNALRAAASRPAWRRVLAQFQDSLVCLLRAATVIALGRAARRPIDAAGGLRAEQIVVLSGGSLAGDAEPGQVESVASEMCGDPTEAAFPRAESKLVAFDDAVRAHVVLRRRECGR